MQKSSRLEKSGRLFQLILCKCFSLDFFHFFYGNINQIRNLFVRELILGKHIQDDFSAKAGYLL